MKPEDLSERREPRVTVNKEFDSFDSFITQYVTNVSRSGVFVKSQNPLPLGTTIDLQFTIIMDDLETIKGVGKVVRVELDPPGMGVVFTEINEYSKNLLDRLLTAKEA
jgi:hypothetical protein